MLIGIPEVMNPELMYILMSMGHGDELVIGDINFPQELVESGRVVYCKGLDNQQMLDAITKLMPLDHFVDDPVILMEPGELYKGTPPIWEKYDEILKRTMSAKPIRSSTKWSASRSTRERKRPLRW